jgi:hypothetical protein
VVLVVVLAAEVVEPLLELLTMVLVETELAAEYQEQEVVILAEVKVEHLMELIGMVADMVVVMAVLKLCGHLQLQADRGRVIIRRIINNETIY